MGKNGDPQGDDIHQPLDGDRIGENGSGWQWDFWMDMIGYPWDPCMYAIYGLPFTINIPQFC